MTTVGSLCSGAGGLDMAVADVLGEVRHAWVAEVDRDASTVLAERIAVPNLGDITAVDWRHVEPVDVLVAGYPCTDLSNAGRRAGIEGRHSGIWRNVADAVRVLRPRLVLLENVAAHLARGFGRVLGDLAEAGYDARWLCLQAADVGAPHRRDRVFIAAADPRGEHVRLEPEPVAGRRGPAVTRDARPHALMPTPTAADGIKAGRRATTGNPNAATNWTLGDVAHADRWAQYGPAIARWETVLGRPAPDPTVVGKRGGRRLSGRFVEWLMGWPDGWVTDLVDNTAALRLCGNGVVRQQGAAAFRDLLEVTR